MGRRQTDESGFVKAPAVITKVGVQEYTLDQLGIPGVKGKKMVKVFRPPETVFHEDTIASFQHKPLTDGHPPQGVTTKNARNVLGGHIGEDVQKLDDETLGVTIHLQDLKFISKSKGSQTSAGYDAEIIKDAGEHNGVKYEYRFDGAMIGNHLALVPRARCGTGCKVLDNTTHKEQRKMDTDDKKEVQGMIDSAVKTANEELTTSLTKSFGDTLKTTLTDHQKEVDDKAVEAKKKADEEAVEAKKVADKLIADADAAKSKVDLLVKVKPLMKSDAYDAIKDKEPKEILVACMKDSVEKAEDKTEDYLTAMLDNEIARRKQVSPRVDARAPGAVIVKAIGGRKR